MQNTLLLQANRQSAPGRLLVILQALHLDAPLVGLLLLVSALGLVVLYSAGGMGTALIGKQAIRLTVAFAVLFVSAQIPPRLLRQWAPFFFLMGIALLVAVLLAGATGKGAQRWLDLGFMRFQPSELLKVAVPMMVAWFLADRRLPPRLWPLLACGLIIVIPTLLIAKQPDLGTALLVAAAGIFALLLAGTSWRIVAFFGVVGAAAAPVLWQFMHGYQKQRVLTFLNPESDPLGAGYHIIQSKIAIGSGGLYGKGWLNGTQSQLEFLPERSTDFIFAVIGEEFGLLGSLLLIAIYSLILIRGLQIAVQAQDTFGRLLAGSLTLTFFVYLAVNTGMVTGMLPVVGVPLPLISYGGTSMVTLMASFGLLCSIHTHRRMLAETG